ncbi:MAG: Lrp/AsnC family transcriptional regulator [Nanoarchaeota archaeon]|nr:Lrp/AsnC family transcriptional regulator [Nanoarchaeota archaeon]
MLHLSLKDQKILFILSKNSRLPLSEISKLSGLSRDIVNYRINKLEKTGVIKGFKTIINYRKLGWEEFDIYITTNNTTQEVQEEMITRLAKNRFITWLGTTFGQYDIRISVLAKDNHHLNKLLNDIEGEFSQNIQQYEITTVLKKFKIHPEVLISSFFEDIKGFRLPDKLMYQELKKEKETTIDEKDKILLNEIGKNTRISLVELSQKIGLTPEATKYRIKELERANIIKGYTIAIDGTKLGKIWCVFLFKMANLNEELEKEIETYLMINKHTTSSVKLLGKWNWGMTVYASDMKEIQRILFDVRNRFANNIHEYNLLTIFETYKYPAVAEGVFEE